MAIAAEPAMAALSGFSAADLIALTELEHSMVVAFGSFSAINLRH